MNKASKGTGAIAPFAPPLVVLSFITCCLLTLTRTGQNFCVFNSLKLSKFLSEFEVFVRKNIYGNVQKNSSLLELELERKRALRIQIE